MKTRKFFTWKIIFAWLLIGLFAAACTASPDAGSAADEAEHLDDDHEHDDEEEHLRVPNNGAAVHIISPADGATFKVGDEITVGIEVENFTLGEGNHWHIYVDGASWGMVMGENTDDTLRGLDAGEHEISVFLSIDTHEELEDGDAITIVVEE